VEGTWQEEEFGEVYGANNSKLDLGIWIRYQFLRSELGHGSEELKCIDVFETPKIEIGNEHSLLFTLICRDICTNGAKWSPAVKL
jgi:hypothetical protein